jgi:hypothetical protein
VPKITAPREKESEAALPRITLTVGESPVKVNTPAGNAVRSLASAAPAVQARPLAVEPEDSQVRFRATNVAATTRPASDSPGSHSSPLQRGEAVNESALRVVARPSFGISSAIPLKKRSASLLDSEASALLPPSRY